MTVLSMALGILSTVLAIVSIGLAVLWRRADHRYQRERDAADTTDSILQVIQSMSEASGSDGLNTAFQRLQEIRRRGSAPKQYIAVAENMCALKTYKLQRIYMEKLVTKSQEIPPVRPPGMDSASWVSATNMNAMTNDFRTKLQIGIASMLVQHNLRTSEQQDKTTEAWQEAKRYNSQDGTDTNV